MKAWLRGLGLVALGLASTAWGQYDASLYMRYVLRAPDPATAQERLALTNQLADPPGLTNWVNQIGADATNAVNAMGSSVTNGLGLAITNGLGEQLTNAVNAMGSSVTNGLGAAITNGLGNQLTNGYKAWNYWATNAFWRTNVPNSYSVILTNPVAGATNALEFLVGSATWNQSDDSAILWHGQAKGWVNKDLLRGVVSEGGIMLTMGVNCPQFGNRDTSWPGGAFRVDARNGEGFTVIGYAIGGGPAAWKRPLSVDFQSSNVRLACSANGDQPGDVYLAGDDAGFGTPGNVYVGYDAVSQAYSATFAADGTGSLGRGGAGWDNAGTFWAGQLQSATDIYANWNQKVATQAYVTGATNLLAQSLTNTLGGGITNGLGTSCTNLANSKSAMGQTLSIQGGGTISGTAGSTYYIGGYGAPVAANATWTNACIYLFKSGTLKGFQVKQVVTGTLGTAGQNITYQITKGTASAPVSDYGMVSMDGSKWETDGVDTSVSQAFSAGDWLAVRMTCPNPWTTPAASIRFYFAIYFE